jgi:hypothetical protein
MRDHNEKTKPMKTQFLSSAASIRLTSALTDPQCTNHPTRLYRLRAP